MADRVYTHIEPVEGEFIEPGTLVRAIDEATGAPVQFVAARCYADADGYLVVDPVRDPFESTEPC